jgi:hypothetical protein
LSEFSTSRISSKFRVLAKLVQTLLYDIQHDTEHNDKKTDATPRYAEEDGVGKTGYKA